MTRSAKQKRLSKADRAIANAERLARLLVAAPAESDTPLAPPAFINDRRLAPALQFWHDHAVQLVKLGTLERLDRFTFALLCIYVGEFIAAEDDILANGYSVRVKTISGDRMPRESPSVARRDFAAKMVLDLSRSFGLTKLDRINISRLERKASDGPLFDEDRARTPLGVPEYSVDDKARDEATDAESQKWRDLLGRCAQTVN